MKTVGQNLLDWTNELAASVDGFLLEHSGVWRWSTPGDGMITPNPFGWENLEPTARSLQTALLDEFRRYSELVLATLSGSAEEVVADVSCAQEEILKCIDQSRSTYYESVGDARSGVEENFEQIRNGLSALVVDADTTPIVLPDTNALLYNPDLDFWRFPKFQCFELLLAPTVLAELDSLKVNHRREALRRKAERLIRQIKGYRARGRLTDGVTLRRGTSTIRALAREPKELPLSWLDVTSRDDRILATTVDVMRQSASRSVMLITRDVNLQNKAEFARVPFAEPPSPRTPESGEASDAPVE